MRHQAPEIVKLSQRVNAHMDQIVMGFARRLKYSIGTRLSSQAFDVARLCMRAWRDVNRRETWLQDLAYAIDDLKLIVQLAQDRKAFRSFAEYEGTARLVNDLGRQCGGWLKQVRPNGQNGSAVSPPFQRASILSARAAPAGLSPAGAHL